VNGLIKVEIENKYDCERPKNKEKKLEV